MITPIKFTIARTELEETLKFLSPFIVCKKKWDIEEEEDDSEIRLPSIYFYDKVTFLLYKSHACISVLTKERVRIERTCDIDSNVENLSFCLPHGYLLQEIGKSESINYTFKEDRFFGFDVYDSISEEFIFAVDAYSVSTQPSIYPESFRTLYTKTVRIERKTLLKSLKLFAKFTENDCLEPFANSIWFFINEGICKVIATTGITLRKEEFQIEEQGNYTFSIPGKFAGRIYEIVRNWNEYICHQVGLNENYLNLYNFNQEALCGETIEVPLNKCKIINLEESLSKRNIIHRSSLRVDNLRSALRMMNTINYKDEYIILHFLKNHVNIHCQDFEKKCMVNEFYDTIECDGDYTIRLHQKKLEGILEEVFSDIVIFTLVDGNLLYISNEDEPLFENIVRLQCTAKMKDEDYNLLERGDKLLKAHSKYLEKYLTDIDKDEYS